MDRGQALLQNFRSQLMGWIAPIKRATYAEGVAFVPHADGEFSVRLTWKTKDGQEKAYEKMFTRQLVFGGSYHLGQNAWRVERRACDHARGLMREVLSARGAI